MEELVFDEGLPNMPNTLTPPKNAEEPAFVSNREYKTSQPIGASQGSLSLATNPVSKQACLRNANDLSTMNKQYNQTFGDAKKK